MDEKCNGYTNFDTFIFMVEIGSDRIIDQQLKKTINSNPLITVNELAKELQTYNPRLRKLNSHVNFSKVNYIEVAEQLLQDLMECNYA